MLTFCHFISSFSTFTTVPTQKKNKTKKNRKLGRLALRHPWSTCSRNWQGLSSRHIKLHVHHNALKKKKGKKKERKKEEEEEKIRSGGRRKTKMNWSGSVCFWCHGTFSRSLRLQKATSTSSHRMKIRRANFTSCLGKQSDRQTPLHHNKYFVLLHSNGQTDYHITTNIQ